MNTEIQPPLALWIDKMSSKDALSSLLKNQGESIKAIENALPSILEVSEIIYNKLLDSDDSRIIYSGAGTSARIAVQDGVELFPTFSWPLSRVGYMIAGGIEALTESVEGAEDSIGFAKEAVKNILITPKDIVIGVTASGNTPFTLKTIEISKKIGATTIGIGNNFNGKIQKKAHYGITLDTGYELVAGSTRLKAGTAQKICLNLISTLCMARLGGVKNGLMINLQPSNLKLKKRIAMIKENFVPK